MRRMFGMRAWNRGESYESCLFLRLGALPRVPLAIVVGSALSFVLPRGPRPIVGPLLLGSLGGPLSLAAGAIIPAPATPFTLCFFGCRPRIF